MSGLRSVPPDMRKHLKPLIDRFSLTDEVDSTAASNSSGSTRVVTGTGGGTPRPEAGTTFADSEFQLYSNATPAKIAKFDCSLIATATPCSISWPAQPGTMARLTDITDALLITSNITTNNVSTSKHGFVPIAPNDTTKFLRGDATWNTVPSGGDSVSVNGTSATDADFDDSTPAAPTGGTNVKWQKDSSTPNNISAYVIGVPSIVFTTSNQDFTAASLEDVTGLAFSVTSGVKYHFRFVIAWKSDATACGPRMSVTFPSVTSFAGVAQATTITTDGVSTHYAGAITSSDDPVIASSTPATGTWYTSIIEGLIVPSANGTLQARYALETAVGSPTVTTAAGSCGFLIALG